MTSAVDAERTTGANHGLPRVVGDSIAYTCTVEEHLTGRRMLYGYQMQLKLALITVVGGFILWTSLTRDPHGPGHGLMMMAPVLLVVIGSLVFMPIIERRSVAAWFRRTNAMNAETTVTWDTEGVSIINAFRRQHCPWSQIHRIRHGRGVIAINGSNGFDVFMPDVEEIRSKLDYLQQNARKRRDAGLPDAVRPVHREQTDTTGGFAPQNRLTFRFGRAHLAELHSLKGLVMSVLFGLLAIGGKVFEVSLTPAAKADPVTPLLYLAGFLVLLTALATFLVRRNRWALQAAVDGEVERTFAWDEQRFSIATGGEQNIYAWTDVSRVESRKRVILLFCTTQGMAIPLPREDGFAAVVRAHLPKLWKEKA